MSGLECRMLYEGSPMMLYNEMRFHCPCGLIHFADRFDKAFQMCVYPTEQTMDQSAASFSSSSCDNLRQPPREPRVRR